MVLIVNLLRPLCLLISLNNGLNFPRVVRGTPYPVLGGGGTIVYPRGGFFPLGGGEESLGGKSPFVGGFGRGYILSPSYKPGGGWGGGGQFLPDGLR